ncbi:PQQ-dependent sugar dehydrogenase [Thalassotalea euphylliae]|uniref:PQQ-dependent sugar dehydrogenase n=1 Tax=Thalassotalea euphylliae TaxID=1655234 RepID=UPI003641A9C1
MSQIAWLLEFKKKLLSYPTKGLLCKQFIPSFALAFIASFTVSADSIALKESYNITTLATDLQSPWSMVKLPSGKWLITERDGHVVIVNGNEQTRAKLAFDGLYVAGQGGLLDVVLSPHFDETNEVFFSYAQGELSANRLVIAKAKFTGEGFAKPDIVYQVATDKGTPQHYAGRILILPDDTLLFSSGDGFDYREQAQVVTSQLGKFLRINLDGSIPKDNPFVAHENAVAHAVFSVGHRNPQGLIYDTDSQQIVSHEHGPAGGDELNYLVAGNNYGWPVITYGKDYSQARISPFTEYQGMEKPSVDWTPSIAPSGMAYYSSTHKRFESLQRHALVTTLVERKLYSVNLADGAFNQSHVFTEVTGRLRDVYVTPEGDIAVLTDGKDAKLMLINASVNTR